ncbi:diguanylate cyclase [Alloiococcus sp. CFN-8]|uniref:diguanylate cyclase n=1 Tax=Alloiococcus sp. CFN-8 TaxID=3416081 RepID=UPI003CEA6641
MMSLLTIKTIFPAVAFICFMLLLLIFLYSKKTKERIMYSIFLIAMSIWSLGSLFMRLQFLGDVLLWNKLICTGMIGTSLIFYHFSLVFVRNKINKRSLYINYFIAFLLLIINASGALITDATITPEGLSYVLGWGAYVFAIWGNYLFILSVVRILEPVKKKEIPLEKVILIIVGMAATVIGALLNFFNESIGRYPVDIALNLFNAICIFYSIYRHRFLGTRLIVRKLINIIGFIIIQMVIFYLFLSVFKRIKFGNNLSGILSGVLIVVFNVLFHDKFKLMVGDFVDILFYKEKISQKGAMREYSEKLISCLEISEIGEYVIEAINKILQPEKVFVFLEQYENNPFKPVARSDDSNEFININLTNRHPLVKWLKERVILTSDELCENSYFNSLWSSEKEEISILRLELFAPIKLRGQVLGIVGVGEKSDGTSYHKDDIDNLITIINGAAPAFDNARNYQKAKEQSVTDGLTGLYNHRYFYNFIENKVNYKEFSSIAVVMFDVDYFKFYNDIYGHAAGDAALKSIGKIIKSHITERDVACRYGGEEFAVILMERDEKEAFDFAERVRKDVQTFYGFDNNVQPLISLSCGVVAYPFNDLSKNQLLEKADKAMYTAKRLGKNRTKLYEKEMEDKGYIGEEEDLMLASMFAIAGAVDLKDKYKFVHSENVSRYGVLLGEALGFDEEMIEILRMAGLLHDVGKIGIPNRILCKEGRLTENEMAIMRKHVELSVDIFKHVPALIKVVPAVLCHHERYDGLGYPRGIKGEGIPEEARCLSIVDAYDAMTSNRSYKKAISIDEAIYEIDKNKGTQFDPHMAQVFIKLLNEKRELFI